MYVSYTLHIYDLGGGGGGGGGVGRGKGAQFLSYNATCTRQLHVTCILQHIKMYLSTLVGVPVNPSTEIVSFLVPLESTL